MVSREVRVIKNILEGKQKDIVNSIEEEKVQSNTKIEELDSIDFTPQTIVKATITRIEKGLLKDFIPEEKLIKKENSEREAYKIYFTTETGENGSFILQKSNRPNSNLAKFVSKYGKPPSKGMTINATYVTKQNGIIVLKPIL